MKNKKKNPFKKKNRTKNEKLPKKPLKAVTMRLG